MGQKKKNILLVFIFVAIFSLFIIQPFLFTFPKNIAASLVKFPLKIISLSFAPINAFISCNRSLKQASILKKENQQLRIELMRLKELEQENKRLDQLLSFKEKSKFSLVAARVISFDSSNFKRSLIIDKGKKHKIKIGNPVISSLGMVGAVVEAGERLSRVILINDPDFSMSAKIERSNVIGVVSGSLEGSCKLRYLDLDEDIQTGDEVTSAGQNFHYPAGIPIGTVTSVAKEHSGLNLFAVVKPKAKLSSLEEVLVVIDY